MKYHMSVSIEKGLQKLQGGDNIFTGTPLEAFHALMDSRAAGKEFFTGCDNEKSNGMCGGHEDDNTF